MSGMSLNLSRDERFESRSEFLRMAGDAFDAMFDSDQQEQLITLTQREDRVLQRGAALQHWLLERHLASDPATSPKGGVRCPKCKGEGVPDKSDATMVPRRVTTRAGPQELARRKYRSLSHKPPKQYLTGRT